MSRWPALMGKPDANQPEIIKALEAVGATVHPLPIGKGLPDLLVGYQDVNYLIEVKMPHSDLNTTQRKWLREYNGTANVARTPAEAFAVI